MFCRMLRNQSADRWALTGLLCLALACGVAAPIQVLLPEDGGISISLRAPQAPIAALETTSSVRLEKHGQAVRLTFHRPERSAHPSSPERPRGVFPRPKTCHAFQLLARRFLRPRQMTSRTPNDADDPFLASPSLS